MNWFFISIVLLQVLTLGIDLAEHGKIKTQKVHAGKTLVGITVVTVLVFFAIKTGF